MVVSTFNSTIHRHRPGGCFMIRIPKKVLSGFPKDAWLCREVKVSGTDEEGNLVERVLDSRPIVRSGAGHFVAIYAKDGYLMDYTTLKDVSVSLDLEG